MAPWFLAGLLGLAHAGVSVRIVSTGTYEATFSYSPPIAAGSVSVAGSFNGWRKDAFLLAGPDSAGSYSGTLALSSGAYPYKFVVDGQHWVHDPGNPAKEPDGFDGFNSVLWLGVEASTGIFHRQSIEYCEWVPREGLAVLRAHVAAGAVSLRIEGSSDVVMESVGSDLWEALIRPPSAIFSYSFMIDSQPYGRFVFDTTDAPRLDVPGWVADSVFYQIFPERFANGDPSNDPPGAEAWGGTPKLDNFFGGDLDGIRQGLSYIEDLGANALYLNPVFAAPSNHKYDTADYRKIDPAFGGDAAFARLAAALKERGMRVILDGVFNHTGDRFWAFQDAVSSGAASPYARWYTFHDFPVTQSPPNYEAWWGFAQLPKLDTTDPEVRDYLLDTAAYWLNRRASGWRLDVPNEVPHGFWKAFRERARKANPEAYLVGEIWTDGLPWLGGDEFDAVMNYPFRSAVLGYFGSGDLGLDELHQRLQEQRHRYPRASLPAQFNLLGSHDTQRLRNAFKGDLDRLKLAVFFQMTYLGVPVVYYGDEVGLPGEKDPDCRRCFPWKTEDQDRGLFEHYRRLIRIRRSLPELRRGDFKVLLMDPAKDLYVFSRGGVLVALHRGSEPVEVSLDPPSPAASFTDLYSGASYPVSDGRLTLKLGAFQGLVLEAR